MLLLIDEDRSATSFMIRDEMIDIRGLHDIVDALGYMLRYLEPHNKDQSFVFRRDQHKSLQKRSLLLIKKILRGLL